MTKRNVLTSAFVFAVVALGLTTRPWVSGTVVDTITGTTKATVKGSTAAPTAFAGALVALAAVIALLSARRVGRTIAGVALALAGALTAYGAGRSAFSAKSVLENWVDGSGGHADAKVTASAATGWVWPTLACGILLVLLGVIALIEGRRWSGLGEKYDAPTAPKESDWDQLSAGKDPTAADGDRD
ncbi:Trp biosynthesis-associated membrane protein [Calidifontibacter indicus]|uniref:Trp biosynthesis-associated membrane protein n=1 Tax=Calidifontibacter indicus TaxID=419650 RepID=UPI003D7534B7